ncbi:MAG: dioxygenase [Hyphomicrobiales bacterium]|nr:dioxygenase [Hyphomicrobiales bacterium]
MALPALYISHGSPRLIVEPSAARDFLQGLAKSLRKPRAIVIATAHFLTGRPAVVGDANPGMIYDFGGMPELRKLVYSAPGDPQVAIKVAGLWQAAGFAPAVVTDYGYDHGAWVPLMLLYPEADVPVVPIAVQPQLGPAHHLALGKALASLREENILVIGSGSLTHNLHAFYASDLAADAPALPWVESFTHWIHERIETGAADDLLDYRTLAPHAADNHPTDEHLLPLFIAMGAGGEKGRRIHSSTRNGVIAMDTYAFG